jgi:glycosyl transferase family 1
VSSADDALIDQLVQCERAGDLAAALSLLGAKPQTPKSLATIALSLYRRDLSALAFIIAQKLLDAGVENWILHALAAHLALRLEQPEAAARSIPRLAQLLAGADAVQRRAVRSLLDPFLPRDAVVACHNDNHALNRAYTRLWSVVDPQIITRLARPPAEHVPDTERFLTPDNGGRLLNVAAPPAGMPRIARKAVLGIRHRWNPLDAKSREHDLPIRIVAGFDEYGWRSLRHDLRSLEDRAIIAEDYRALAAICRESGADLLILDDFQPRHGGNAAGEILRALRRERPSLRVVGIYMDPWLPEQWNDIEAGADCLDAVWSAIVTPVWNRPAFTGKTLFLPYPFGGSYAPAPRIEPRFRFGGGVQYGNWDRAFWLAAIAEAGLPVAVAASTHVCDDLSALDSFRAYMRNASTGEATLNFARRSNGTHTLTGRTFEAPATGSLLVQERSDDIDLFFIAGQHYLRFETLTDLFDIAHLLKTAPDRAEAIRQAGAAFFAERYSDERLVAYLDHFLFHRESAARTAA